MEPIGLYLHIPYCLHKCGYCDFNSHNLNEEEMESYVAALLREMEYYAGDSAPGRNVATIFFGGGTPTTLPAPVLAGILASCRRHFAVAADAEITCEVNPATIHCDELKTLRAGGFNRLSIGVQSFDPDELSLLERVHSVEEIHLTVDRARQAGFDNLSLDLMFALPGQTLKKWHDNLEKAIAKQPNHLSAYNLTIESGTAFHKLQERGKLVMPPDDFQLELFKSTRNKLADAGYRQYEISNYCKPGFESRHNLGYWEFRDYLGLGAGASSCLDGVRFKNHNLPARYIREVTAHRTAVEFEERPDARQAMGEALMLGLRLQQGVDLPRLEKKLGISLQDEFGEAVARLQAQQWLTLEGGRLALTEQGLYLADSVILEFISEPVT